MSVFTRKQAALLRAISLGHKVHFDEKAYQWRYDGHGVTTTFLSLQKRKLVMVIEMQGRHEARLTDAGKALMKTGDFAAASTALREIDEIFERIKANLKEIEARLEKEVKA